MYEDPHLVAKMNNHLQQLKDIICNMDGKRGNIFIDWMKNQNTYLQWEENFKPSFLRAYKRGEIVLANFGFNMGAEYGGMHYAIVMRNSTKNNPNLNVVPLSSLEEDVSKENIHKDRVFLGKIKGLNNKRAMAIPDQIDLIDDKIRRLYTKL